MTPVQLLATEIGKKRAIEFYFPIFFDLTFFSNSLFIVQFSVSLHAVYSFTFFQLKYTLSFRFLKSLRTVYNAVIDTNEVSSTSLACQRSETHYQMRDCESYTLHPLVLCVEISSRDVAVLV